MMLAVSTTSFSRPQYAVRRWALGALLTVVGLLAGCATVANPDKRDPLESFNRGMFSFNDGVDRVVLKPVAKGYQAVVPQLVRRGVGNFFNNLSDVWSAINNGLQARGEETGDSVGRVMVNTTLGLGGVIDVASDLGIDRHRTNFGATLGRWGVFPGPYIVLPLLGPATLREVAALPVDQQGSLITHVPNESTRTGLTVLNVVDLRAQYLRAGDVVNGAALDRYTFTREAYLQRQRNADYDGDPPEEDMGP
ncbi:MAG: VacJ family lipoprotein [Rhodoferax sp.]|nr:VacJ family lipoprotein [Rhodoferax sp.]